MMPMGCHNSPAMHQHHITLVLKDHIGKICHVYLNNIIIWSNSIEEHERNITSVLQALHDAHPFCSIKKSKHFLTEIDFLGHHISSCGMEANPSKVQKVLDWL